MQQHCFSGRQCQRMPNEGAGKKCYAHLRKRSVAIIPLPAVKRVHVFRVAGHRANRNAAANYFSIGRQIGAHTKISLCSPGLHAEAGDHLIKNQRRASFLGYFAQFLQKFTRLQIQSSALHRLDQHRGDFRTTGAQNFE